MTKKLCASLLKEWKERKEKYHQRHDNYEGEDKTYNAGVFDELQTCILELEDFLKTQ